MWVLIILYGVGSKPQNIVINDIPSYGKCEEAGRIVVSKLKEEAYNYPSFVCVPSK